MGTMYCHIQIRPRSRPICLQPKLLAVIFLLETSRWWGFFFSIGGLLRNTIIHETHYLEYLMVLECYSDEGAIFLASPFHRSFSLLAWRVCRIDVALGGQLLRPYFSLWIATSDRIGSDVFVTSNSPTAPTTSHDIRNCRGGCPINSWAELGRRLWMKWTSLRGVRKQNGLDIESQNLFRIIRSKQTTKPFQTSKKCQVLSCFSCSCALSSHYFGFSENAGCKTKRLGGKTVHPN